MACIFFPCPRVHVPRTFRETCNLQYTRLRQASRGRRTFQVLSDTRASTLLQPQYLLDNSRPLSTLLPSTPKTSFATLAGTISSPCPESLQNPIISAWLSPSYRPQPLRRVLHLFSFRQLIMFPFLPKLVQPLYSRCTLLHFLAQGQSPSILFTLLQCPPYILPI